MKISMKLKGDEEMRKNLLNCAKNCPMELLRACIEEMEIEKIEMQARTPVKTGLLRDSLAVMTPEVKNGKVIVTVGTDVEYAVFVHENLDAWHEEGEAKFIESVLNEAADSIAARIAARIDLNRMVNG
jgi:hypothetical protein